MATIVTVQGKSIEVMGNRIVESKYHAEAVVRKNLCMGRRCNACQRCEDNDENREVVRKVWYA